LEGILSLWPTTDTAGEFSFGKRFDGEMMRQFNDRSKFHGQIENTDRFDWSDQDYVEAWNTEFPSDLIE